MPTLFSPGPVDLSCRIRKLDGLYGIAISMVIIWHDFASTIQAKLAGHFTTYRFSDSRQTELPGTAGELARS